MPTKKTLAKTVVALITLLGLSGCAASARHQYEHNLTLERKEISNDNLSLQHLAKCDETARELGVPVWYLKQCKEYLGGGSSRENYSPSQAPQQRRRFQPYYE
jgi:hypothetical protein